MNRKTKLSENALIWFGAAVSIAEIITGSYFAPLGFTKGLAAILLGHLIGGVLLFLSGIIGGSRRKSSMESTVESFGRIGGLFFALMNLLQLLGWTAIMIYDGALAANSLFKTGRWLWCIIIGGLIVLWILVGVTKLRRLNIVAIFALGILTLVLCTRIFRGSIPIGTTASNVLSFGAALELAVAMPLSWLPLISDYTREAEKPVLASAVSAAVYTLVSCWMYTIGMGAAIFTGQSDIAQIILNAGLGMAGLLIIVLSTVTTTFLDAWSAGISAEVISDRLDGKIIAILVALSGTVFAIMFPMDDISNFLYLIGSVFAPMIAIQIADFFILRTEGKRRDSELSALIAWMLGFIIYRLLMRMDIPVGNTLPDMFITIMIRCIITLVVTNKHRKSENTNEYK